jgi:hypothetical protein
MNRTPHALHVLAVAVALALAAPAAADDAWRLEVSGNSVQSTDAGGPSGSPGFGLGIGYRATPRIGVGLYALTGELDEQARFRFVQPNYFTDKQIRMTPVLARLDLHLTSGPRVDLYFGPVAGYAWMGDLEVRTRLLPIRPGQRARGTLPVEDQFTWGGHVGVVLRLGDGRSSLTAGATYLDLPLEIDRPDPGRREILFIPIGDDVDPLFFHVGYAYAF